MRRLFYSLLLVFFYQFSQAQVMTSSEIDEFLPKGTQKYQIEAQLSNTTFVSSDAEYFRKGEAEKELGELAVNAKSKYRLLSGEASHFYFNVDTAAIYSRAEEALYINPKDLNLSYELSNSALKSVSLGRKRQTWSSSDELWQTGQWQPRFAKDRMNYEQQGLFGVFTESQIEKVKFNFFVSGLYLPETGPQFDIKDGQFESKNPWFSPPVKKASVQPFFNEEDIYYDVVLPKTSDIVLQESVAFSIEYGQPEAYCRLAYAYKPMNQLSQNIDVYVRSELPSAPPGVDITPEVNYHQLATTECGSDLGERTSAWLSYTAENPERDPSTPGRWTRQNYTSASVFSGYLSYDLNNLEQLAPSVYVSFYNLVGGNAPDEGNFKGDSFDDSKFQGRYLIYQAAQVGYKSIFTLPSWPGKYLNLNSSATYDFKQRGAMFSTKLSLAYSSQLNLFLNADLIGVVSRSDEDNGISTGLMREYRSNDQVKMGASYVF